MRRSHFDLPAKGERDGKDGAFKGKTLRNGGNNALKRESGRVRREGEEREASRASHSDCMRQKVAARCFVVKGIRTGSEVMAQNLLPRFCCNVTLLVIILI